MKQVLDPCCGSKMFWFDKNNPAVQFGDCREEEHTLCDGRTLKISPDQIMDFCDLPFDDRTFKLVVFDPPHLKYVGPRAWMRKKYGGLDKDTWPANLTQGFDECWRVLDQGGTLIFKWNETQIKIREVLACFSQRPLFGHTTTQNLKTHWMTFYKPLADATCRRIARGLMRYVIEADKPYIVQLDHQSSKNGVADLDAPLTTITSKARHLLVAPILTRHFGQGIGRIPDQPSPTVMPGGQGKTALVAAFLAKHYTGVTGHGVEQPIGTVTTSDHHSLVTSHLIKFKGTCKDGQPVTEPLHTVQAHGLHYGEVRAFLIKYYGAGTGQHIDKPLHTVTTKDRYGVVTVDIGGEPYAIADIGMRMLQPHELFAAQGFPSDYIIDPEFNGKPMTKTNQVRMAGNSVCPPVAAALVRANVNATAIAKPAVA